METNYNKFKKELKLNENLEQYAKELTTTKTTEEADVVSNKLGKLIAENLEWDGIDICRVFIKALTDSNFHKLTTKIVEAIKEIEGVDIYDLSDDEEITESIDRKAQLEKTLKTIDDMIWKARTDKTIDVKDLRAERRNCEAELRKLRKEIKSK